MLVKRRATAMAPPHYPVFRGEAEPALPYVSSPRISARPTRTVSSARDRSTAAWGSTWPWCAASSSCTAEAHSAGPGKGNRFLIQLPLLEPTPWPRCCRTTGTSCRSRTAAAYLRDQARGMAAVDQHIEYKRELRAGDVVVVRSRLLEFGGRKIRFRHEMRNADTDEVATITTLLGVHMDTNARKACPFPPELLARGEALLHGAR